MAWENAHEFALLPARARWASMSLSTSSLSAVMPSDAHASAHSSPLTSIPNSAATCKGLVSKSTGIAAARRRSHMACMSAGNSGRTPGRSMKPPGPCTSMSFWIQSPTSWTANWGFPPLRRSTSAASVGSSPSKVRTRVERCSCFSGPTSTVLTRSRPLKSASRSRRPSAMVTVLMATIIKSGCPDV